MPEPVFAKVGLIAGWQLSCPLSKIEDSLLVKRPLIIAIVFLVAINGF